MRTVLAGTMNKTSNQFSVTARLINVTDGAELWSATYDRYRYSTNIGDIATELVRDVARQLNFSLDDQVFRRLATSFLRKRPAYVLYSQASTNIASAAANTQDGFYKTIELLNQTLAEHPDLVRAYADLAFCYASIADGLLPPKQAMTAARMNAQRALQLDESLPKAHIALGMVLLYHDLDFPNGEAHFRRAIEVAPRYGTGYGYYVNALSFLGRFDDADKILKQGEQLVIEDHNFLLGWCWRYYAERRYTNLLQKAHQLRTFHPNSPVGLMFQAMAHERLHQYSEALTIQQRVKQLDPSPDIIAFLGMIHARMGNRNEAEKALEEVRVFAQARRGSGILDAMIWLGLAEKDRAMEQLQRAAEDYPPRVLWLKADPLWDELRFDPRFIALLNKVGLEK